MGRWRRLTDAKNDTRSFVVSFSVARAAARNLLPAVDAQGDALLTVGR
jgi:hypothetical protein